MNVTLSNDFMLSMLAKVQPLQAETLKTSHSAHIDANYREPILPGFEKEHISFDFYIYEENTLVKSFEFSAYETEEFLEAQYASVVAYVNFLKKSHGTKSI